MKLILRYIKNLGFINGLTLFFKVELLKLAKFRMMGHPGMVYIRSNTSDIKVFREVFLFRIYSFKVDFSPSVIVDAGANIGLSSIFFATRFPGATVYAVEPESSNFQALLRNTSSYTNIKSIQSALWSSDAVLKITDQSENHWAFTVTESQAGDSRSFKAMSVISLMEHCGIERIDLLKMDIEGAEREVFNDECHRWLPKTGMIVIELHDWLHQDCSRVFFNAIARYPITTIVHEGMLLIKFNR